MQAEGITIGGGYGFPLYKEPALTNSANLPPFDYPDYNAMNLPVAEKTARCGLLIPQHILLADPEDAMDIVHAMEKVWDEKESLTK
jgi:hypothetical protein